MSPRASDELRERWGGVDHTRAMDHLEPNFTFGPPFGTIRPRRADYLPTDDDLSAIDFLCEEWDFCWEPRP